MAQSAEDTAEKFMECSLCFENDDLKRLPCNPAHIYCVTCLTKDSETTEIIKCPLCRTVFDEGIDDIPSAGAPLDKFLCCDVCMRKDDKRRLAQIYCVICQKKFCTPHEKSHNDALDDHMRIRMNEYKKDYRKLETRFCETHRTKVYSLVCEKCHQVFCTHCVHEISKCRNEESHELMPIEMLVTKLTEMVNEKKVLVFDKEEHLLGMTKQLTAIIIDWDTETQQMIEKLHQARDEQIADLTNKYAVLEEQLVEMRTKAKTEVTHYLDDEIGVKLDKLSRQVARIDTRIYTHHEVDVACGYKDTSNLIGELMKMQVTPYHPSSNHVHLTNKVWKPELSVEITPSHSEISHLVDATSTVVLPPNQMNLINTIELRAKPHSILKGPNNSIYVGATDCNLVKMDIQTGERSLDTAIGYWIPGIQTYGDQIYTLLHDQDKNRVDVLDQSGNRLRSWDHLSNSSQLNKLRIVAGKVVIPSGLTGCLTVYSLEGRLEKEIECPGIVSDGPKALAVCGGGSVIVSDLGTSSVSRVNLDSGEVMWTSNHVYGPQGVVCYKNRYVLVSNRNRATKIRILDAYTGDLVEEMTGSGYMYWCDHYDLEIHGDTLYVALSSAQAIRCYQLSIE